MQPGLQLYVTNAEHLREFVQPVKNSEHTAFMNKPERQTGLWTSTWREETRDSDWVEWCRSADFGAVDTKIWWRREPPPDANLYVISSYFELLTLLTNFPWETAMLKQLNQQVGPTQPYLVNFRTNSRGRARTLPIERVHFAWVDFERLAQEYDGIWLTEAGNAATHLSFPHNLSSWDCESILWFRWCFTSVERIETPRPVPCCEEE